MKNPAVVRLPDAAVEEAVKKLIQGPDEHSSGEHLDRGDIKDDSQTDGESTAEFCRKRSQRLYNWNTTHFYPDIHKVDVVNSVDDDDVRQRTRRHSEPNCARLARDFATVDGRRASSSSNSVVSTASSEASSCVGDNTDDVIMPVSELSVWVSTSREQLSTPQADHHSSAFESGSDSAEGDASRQTTVWQRNPLHVKMGKSKSAQVSAAAAERERQTNVNLKSMSSVKSDSAGKQLTLDLIDGGISQITLDRPSVRHRELTEKRREFVRQRCKSQGWDLGEDVEAKLCAAAKEVATATGVEKALRTPGVRLSISRSQEDIRYIEKPATEWSVKGNMEEYQMNQEARIDMKNLIRNFESLTSSEANNSKTKDKKKPAAPVSAETQTNGYNRNRISTKTDYERPSRTDDGREANRSETANKLSSSCEATNGQVKLRSDRVQSAGHRQSYQETRRSLIAPTGVFVSSNRYSAAERSAVLDIGSDAERFSALTSSAPVHTATFEHRVIPQKSEKNPTAAAAEEKDVHSSNKLHSLDRGQIDETDDNNADQYSFTTTVKITSTPRKIIPPDDYEYILRKIHCNQQVSDEYMARDSPPQNSRTRFEVAVGAKQVQALNHGKQAVRGQSIIVKSYASNDGHYAAEDETTNSKLTYAPYQRTLPVNAASYHVNMPAAENRRLSKPDVIPSPTITEMGSAEAVEQQLSARANWLSSSVPAENRDNFVPAAAVEAKIRGGRNDPRESKLSYSRPVSAGCKLVRTMPVEAFDKTPQLANEDWPAKIATDDWLYNTSYEPVSYVQPDYNNAFVADRSRTRQLPERQRNNMHVRPAPPAAVEEALHHLDDDDDFPPPPTPSAFLHEQYRFSIQEPVRTAQPEAIVVVEQNLPLFRSVDDFKRKQVNIPADMQVSQRYRTAAGQPTAATTTTTSKTTTYLSDDVVNGCNRSTVFSLTGYQKPRNPPPAEVAVNEPAYNNWAQMLDCSNTSCSSPLYSSNALTPASDVYSSQEPIYWNSLAAKRRPIVDSREVETALHGTDGGCDESSTCASSSYQSWRATESAASVNRGAEIPDVWQMFDEPPVHPDSPVDRKSEPRRQHSLRDRLDLESYMQQHDRLFESGFVVDDVVNVVDRNYETAAGGGSWSPSDYRDVSVLSTTNHRHQPASGSAAVVLVGQENSVPEQTIKLTQIQGDETTVTREPTYFRTTTCVIQQSPASVKYEKHVVRAQEEHQAQRMMGLNELPFGVELIEATATKFGSSRKSRQADEAKRYEKPSGETTLTDKPQYSVSRAPVQREAKSELARSDNCQDKSKISVLQQQQPQQQQHHKPQQNKVGDDGDDDDENCQPISVAAIKAKLFGANEELAGQLLNGRNTRSSSAPGSPVVKTVPSSAACASTTAASKFATPNAVIARKIQPETRGQLPAEPIDDDTGKAHQIVNRDRPISAKECKTDEESKRLSITNVRMLESSQARSDRQCPSLTYAEEWLASSHSAILHNKPDPFSFNRETTGPVDETAICGKQSILSGCSNPDVRFRTQCEATLTTPSTSMSSLPLRNKPEDDHTDGNPAAEKMSFLSRCEVRRSLPNMSDRDIRRWQSILSKVPQEEIDARSKENDVDKQPLSSSSSADASNAAAAADSGSKSIGDVSRTDVNTCRTAQLSASLVLTGGPKQTDEIQAVYSPPQTSNEPQTARDVGLHDEALSRSRSSPVQNAVSYEKNANDAKATAAAVEKESSTTSVDVVRTRSETLQSATTDSEQKVFHPVSTSAAVVTEDSVSSVSSSEMNATSVVTPTNTTVCSETAEERMKRLQKLREEWFKSDVGLSTKPRDSRPLLSSADAAATTSTATSAAAQPVCTSSAALNLQSAATAVEGKQHMKSTYVSPLMKDSSSGYVRRPDAIAAAAGAAANKDGSSTQPNSVCQKGVTVDDNIRRPCDRSVTTGVEGGHNVNAAGSKRPLAKVCELTASNKIQTEQLLPTTATTDDDKQRTNVSSDKRLNPSVVLRPPSFVDKRDDKTRSEKYESSQRYEKTVDVARQRTYQSQSQQVSRKLEVKSDKNSTVTQCSSDMKLVQVYRRTEMSAVPSPITVQLATSTSNPPLLQSDRGAQTACIVELSDGEMTDATDVTLDAIVGENQSWRFASDAYEFSDVEFLSSANLSSKYHETRHESKRHTEVSNLMSSSSVMSSSCGQFSSRTDDVVVVEAKSNREAAIEAARAEMKLYRRKKEDKQPNDTPPERQRSIKELVTSFEGLVNPYLRTTRPRSMEIKLSSSSSDDEDDEVGAAPPSGGSKTKKKSQLKCSSSFKEPASASAGYRHRRQVKKLTR